MTQLSSRSWTAWLLGLGLVLAIYVYPLFLAERIPLLDPDEGIHASIAQEMVEGGDWITPRLLGEPFRDKPILFFWAMAGSMAAFGMDEAAVRLPGLICSLLGVLTTGLVARALFDPATGKIAALLQATMILPAALGQSPVHDLMLVPWTNLALIGFWQADRDRTGRGWAGVALAGGALGLAALTKGLLGVALVASPALVYLVLSRRLSLGIVMRAVAALGIAALVAAPWYVVMSLRTPGYAHYFFVERHFQGYVSSTQIHGDAPWHYYLPLLLGGGLPWIAYLPLAAWQAWRDRGVANEASRARLFAWCWLAVSVLFLSTAHSKLITYLLPAFPAIAVLAADLWARCRARSLSAAIENRLWNSFALSNLFGVLVLPIAVYLTCRALKIEFSPLAWLACILFSCTSWLPLWFYSRRSVEKSLAMGGLSMALVFAFVMTMIVPSVAEVKTAKDLALHFNRQGRLPQRLLIAEERLASFIYYLDPGLRKGLTHRRLASIRVREYAEQPEKSPDTLMAIPERSMRRGRHYLGLGDGYVRAGRYRVYSTLDARPQPTPSVARKP